MEGGRYWIGVRDIYIQEAIKQKKLMQIELYRNYDREEKIGTAYIDPKKIVKKKSEPFVGLYPENPMMFYYFAVKPITAEQQERLEADVYATENLDFINSLLKP